MKLIIKIFALVFLGLCAAASSSMISSNCDYKYEDRTYTTRLPQDVDIDLPQLKNPLQWICTRLPVTYKMVGNLMALLSIVNAIEVVTSLGLIWGASKRLLNWVTAWLITTASWILLHSTVAIAFLFATFEPGWIILTSVVGIIVLGMAVLSMLAVLSFHKEMKSCLLLSPTGSFPPALASHAARQDAGESGLTQQQVMQPGPSAPAYFPKSF